MRGVGPLEVSVTALLAATGRFALCGVTGAIAILMVELVRSDSESNMPPGSAAVFTLILCMTGVIPFLVVARLMQDRFHSTAIRWASFCAGLLFLPSYFMIDW